MDCTIKGCPGGYSCLSITSSIKQCVPFGGSCESVVDDEESTTDDKLCTTCSNHSECGGANNYCLRNNLTGETFCGIDCSNSTCPENYYCEYITSSMQQCVPVTGTCLNDDDFDNIDDNTDNDINAKLCSTCSNHSECGGANNYCLNNSTTGQIFCGRDCSSINCPSGYSCEYVSRSASIKKR